MRLVSPTAFKGTRTPLEAARFLASPGDRLLPLSDGGDGFLECLHQALGGSVLRHLAADPFGRVREVPVLALSSGVLAVECAQVVGLAGLDPLDPLKARSTGLGDLLRALCQERAQPSALPDREGPSPFPLGLQRPIGFWIGLGGSATVDGGMDWPALELPPTRVFCDVKTELRDAARLFGPQKGARAEDIPLLEARLAGLGLPGGPHTGAAGGLGARLQALGAELVNGAEAMLDALGFDAACQGCEAVLTGEGRLDASTLEGKLPAAVARRVRERHPGLPVQGHFGCRGEGWERAAALFDVVTFEVLD